MSAAPQSGTYRLDGMLQGPLAAGEDHGLRAWADSAKAAGLIFHLRVEGGTFSFVADPVVRKSSGLKGGDLEEVMAAGLNALLELLPPHQRSGCFSTLRSEEFLPGTAVQTLYPVGPDGRIHPEQRTADIDTAAAAPEITPASLRRAVLPALVALLLVLFVSTFFIDYRRLFSDARERLAPLKKEELVVRLETGGDYLAFELKEVDAKRNTLIFALSRGSGWDAAMAASPADAAASGWKEYTTLLALRQGRLRIGLHDKEGKLLVTREVDVRALMEKESIEVAVVAHPEERIASVVLLP